MYWFEARFFNSDTNCEETKRINITDFGQGEKSIWFNALGVAYDWVDVSDGKLNLVTLDLIGS